MNKDEIEAKVLGDMIRAGRTDFGTAAFSRDLEAAVLAAMNGGHSPRSRTPQSRNPQTDRKQAEGRKELDAVMAANHKAGAVSDEDYEQHLAGKAFDGQLPSSERRGAISKLGTLGAKRQTKAAREQAASDREDTRAADFAKKALEGAREKERQETERARKAAEREDSNKLFGANPAVLARTGTWAAWAVLHGVQAAFGSGLQMGNAAGAFMSGLSHAFTGAASGFVHIGDGLLSLVLSPFGRAGGAMTKVAGSLGQSLVSVLSAGGGVLAAGVKVGVGLTTGILAGMASLSGAGLGAVIGGILGSVLPGGGTVAGAMLGAGIGSQIAGSILQTLTGIVGTVSSALGQAMNAIGDAFGSLGSAVGDTLSSIKNVLSDLIETGVKMSTVSLATQRNSGMSGQASSDSTALSQVLTGGPGAFAGMFGNVGMMRRYMDTRASAFGVRPTGSFVDNLPGLYQKYQSYGDSDSGALRRRVMLSIAAPGAQDAIGGLFSLGGGMVNKAVSTAKAIALTPAENKANASLGMDLSVVQAQLDRLKTKLLTDLMPAITATLNVFTKWFAGHQGQIVSGLEAVGKWLYVKLPTYLQAAMNGFFELGKSLAASLPAVAEFGKSVYSTFAQITNGLRAGFGALLTTAGMLLTSLSAALAATPMGWASPGLLKAGLGLSQSGLGLTTSPGLDPHGLDKVLDKLGAASPGLVKSMQSAQDKANTFLGGAFGTEAERAEGWWKNGPGVASPAGAAGSQDIMIKGEFTVRPEEESFARFERRVGDKTIQRIVRANQRT